MQRSIYIHQILMIPQLDYPVISTNMWHVQKKKAQLIVALAPKYAENLNEKQHVGATCLHRQ